MAAQDEYHRVGLGDQLFDTRPPVSEFLDVAAVDKRLETVASGALVPDGR